MPGPLQAVYYATKAFVTSFGNAIAEELHDTNVTVTTLMPAPTETEFAQTSGMTQTSLFSTTVSARTVAEEGYKAMLAGELNAFAGTTFVERLTLAVAPLVPKRMQLRQVRKMQEV